jgi:1,4-dihydroxy-2-naphthoate octaprenyltransferase
MISNLFKNLIKTLQPLWLAAGILMYTLGGGVARFLGSPNGSEVFWPGLGIAVLLLASAFLLNEFFEFYALPPVTTLAEQQSRWRNRSLNLVLVATSLTVAASLALALINQISARPQVVLVLALILLCSIAYATPPMRLASNGYGELVLTIMVSVLFPALGFTLLYEDMHRLLPMVTFPLSALQLAMQLAFGLPHYATDIKHGRKALLLRMGWERGMFMHNLLIPLAFFLLSSAMFYGLPFVIGGPALLALPLGGLQILLVRQIILGGKPNWRALRLNAAAMFGVTAYILTFGFWTN